MNAQSNKKQHSVPPLEEPPLEEPPLEEESENKMLEVGVADESTAPVAVAVADPYPVTSRYKRKLKQDGDQARRKRQKVEQAEERARAADYWARAAEDQARVAEEWARAAEERARAAEERERLRAQAAEERERLRARAAEERERLDLAGKILLNDAQCREQIGALHSTANASTNQQLECAIAGMNHRYVDPRDLALLVSSPTHGHFQSPQTPTTNAYPSSMAPANNPSTCKEGREVEATSSTMMTTKMPAVATCPSTCTDEQNTKNDVISSGKSNDEKTPSQVEMGDDPLALPSDAVVPNQASASTPLMDQSSSLSVASAAPRVEMVEDAPVVPSQSHSVVPSQATASKPDAPVVVLTPDQSGPPHVLASPSESGANVPSQASQSHSVVPSQATASKPDAPAVVLPPDQSGPPHVLASPSESGANVPSQATASKPNAEPALKSNATAMALLPDQSGPPHDVASPSRAVVQYQTTALTPVMSSPLFSPPPARTSDITKHCLDTYGETNVENMAAAREDLLFIREEQRKDLVEQRKNLALALELQRGVRQGDLEDRKFAFDKQRDLVQLRISQNRNELEGATVLLRQQEIAQKDDHHEQNLQSVQELRQQEIAQKDDHHEQNLQNMQEQTQLVKQSLDHSQVLSERAETEKKVAEVEKRTWNVFLLLMAICMAYVLHGIWGSYNFCTHAEYMGVAPKAFVPDSLWMYWVVLCSWFPTIHPSGSCPLTKLWALFWFLLASIGFVLLPQGYRGVTFVSLSVWFAAGTVYNYASPVMMATSLILVLFTFLGNYAIRCWYDLIQKRSTRDFEGIRRTLVRYHIYLNGAMFFVVVAGIWLSETGIFVPEDEEIVDIVNVYFEPSGHQLLHNVYDYFNDGPGEL